MNGLSAEYEAEIVFLGLNAADPINQALQSELGVVGHPSSVVLDEAGVVQARFFGPETAAGIRPALDAVLAP